MTETMSFDAATFTAQGTERDRVSLPADLFDGTVNMPVMHQAVKAYLANQRQGNAATKTRRYVVGGNQKPWKQKGTGRARQGSIRAPHWVGGGTVFGPTPRSYAQYVPRQVRALARKSALNARARENAIFVIDSFDYERPKTARLQAMLDRLDLAGRKVLILTDGAKPNVHLSGRNLPTVHVMPYADVSTYHILWSDVVVIEAGALGHRLEPVAEREPTEKPRRSKKKAAKRTAAAAEGESDVEAAGDDGAPSARKRGTARKKSAAKGGARKAASKAATKRSSTRKSAARKGGAKKPKKKGS